MKKIILGMIALLIIFFVYEYQKPIMTTGEATKQALVCLNNPPKKLGIKPFNLNLSDIKSGQMSIDAKSGFFNNLTNKRELSVTLKFKGGLEPTFRMNAYNGECIEVTGPLN